MSSSEASTSEESYSESETDNTSDGNHIFTVLKVGSYNWEDSSSEPIMSSNIFESLKSKLVFSEQSASVTISLTEANQLKQLMEADQDKKLYFQITFDDKFCLVVWFELAMRPLWFFFLF